MGQRPECSPSCEGRLGLGTGQSRDNGAGSGLCRLLQRSHPVYLGRGSVRGRWSRVNEFWWRAGFLAVTGVGPTGVERRSIRGLWRPTDSRWHGRRLAGSTVVTGGAQLSSPIRHTVSVAVPTVAGSFIAEISGGYSCSSLPVALSVAAGIATASPAIRPIEDSSAQPA